MASIANPLAIDRASWEAARVAHLEDEKEFTKLRDDLSRKRRELPWLEITDDYTFTGLQGKVRLSDLFGDSSQLLVYHFMFGPGWEEGCPSCSYWADNFEGIEKHLEARDTSLVCISRGPIEEIQNYQSRMGWTFNWYSSADSSFNYDMRVSFTPEELESGRASYNFGTSPAHGDEMPGISIFAKQTDADGSSKIYLTYQTFARGLDMLNGAYHMLDLTPKERDEQDLEFSMAWLRRHDSY